MDDSWNVTRKILVNVSLLWATGGEIITYPRMVNRMLIKRSAPQPRSKKTPTGGRKMARMILQISLQTVSRRLRLT